MAAASGSRDGDRWRTWSSRLVTAALVLLIVASVVVVPLVRSDPEHKRFPAWIWDLLLESPPGLLPLAVLGLTVLVAYPVYARLRWLAWLVPIVAVVAATLVVLQLPNGLHDHGWGLSRSAVPWMRAILAGLLAILVGKFLLLHRHATRSWRQHRSEGRNQPALLPSQKVALDDLKQLILDQRRHGIGQVIPLDGRPGDGKSFLVRRLKEDWDHTRQLKDDEDGKRLTPPVVIIDVWRQQTEADLQVAILEEMFSHPAYLERLSWLGLPVSFLFARFLAQLRRLRSTLRVRLLYRERTGVELDMELPDLRWQAQFERATARLARRGTVTVVVLDELDRAERLVTQAALTLARRSVDIPGVAVIIPYIRSHIRHKAFNPLRETLPDLGSSMEAILEEHEEAVIASIEASRRKARDQLLAAGRRETDVLGLPSLPDGSLLGHWETLRELEVARAAGFLPKKEEIGSKGEGAAASDQRTAAVADEQLWLRLGVFARADRELRERLQERFEEKYLGPPAVSLRGVDPDDLAAMVTCFDSLERQTAVLLGRTSKQLDDPRKKRISSLVRDGLRQWREIIESEGWKMPGPPVRSLEGILFKALQSAVSTQKAAAKPDVHLDAAEIATLAIGAYYMAVLIHGD